jgi:hypothetical protein
MQRGRLAGAVGPRPEDVAARDREIDAVDGDEISVALDETPAATGAASVTSAVARAVLGVADAKNRAGENEADAAALLSGSPCRAAVAMAQYR